jgi:glycerate kinase
MVVELEEALTRWAEVLKRDLDKDVGAAVGAGAAGGLGAALMAFLGGQPRLGVQLVLETAGFEEYLESADLVLSGEGSIDTQTLYGKTLVGVARLAQRHGVPVIAIAGSIRGELDELLGMGLASAFSLTPGPLSEAEAMRDAGQLLQDTTERVIRALLVGREMGARLGSGS